jgi:hypothetical protein
VGRDTIASGRVYISGGGVRDAPGACGSHGTVCGCDEAACGVEPSITGGSAQPDTPAFDFDFVSNITSVERSSGSSCCLAFSPLLFEAWRAAATLAPRTPSTMARCTLWRTTSQQADA